MLKRSLFIHATCFLLVMVCSRVPAQTGISTRDLAEKFSHYRNTNSEIKKHYTWSSRTDVIREGKVMDILIEEIKYGPEGELQKKTVNEEEAKLPSSFLIHKIAEEGKAKMVNFFKALRVFMEEYAFENEEKRDHFITNSVIGEPDPNSIVMVAGENVIVKGDRLQWWINLKNYSIEKVTIATYFEGDQIEFTATYKNLNQGFNYMAFAELLVPAKSVTVQVHCYDYVRTD